MLLLNFQNLKCLIFFLSRALFDYDDHVSSNIKEKQGSSIVSLDHMGIDEHTFKSILDFIYTAEVKLNPGNIQDMLQVFLKMCRNKVLMCTLLNSRILSVLEN